MPVEKVRYDKIDVVSCDERGRATLGTEFANEEVWVYIAELPDIEELEEPSGGERGVLMKMTDWAIENGINPMDWDSELGVVKDKEGNQYQTPHALGEIPNEAPNKLSMETGRPMSEFEV